MAIIHDTHEYDGFANGDDARGNWGLIALCSCGWESGRVTTNPRKSWRQHVTRNTK